MIIYYPSYGSKSHRKNTDHDNVANTFTHQCSHTLKTAKTAASFSTIAITWKIVYYMKTMITIYL